MKQIPLSIGIFAHNEEKNISRVLDSILKQKTEIAIIKEIIIVSSGSNDRTNSITRTYQKKDKRFKLLEQYQREGKSSAINYYLSNTKEKIVVMISGDLKLHTHAIEEIALPFLNQDVGMAGAHPVPSNASQSQIGKEIKLLWELHHLVSLHHPKCGEMVAFRNVIRSIPKESAVDEANIEVLLKLIGYQVIYTPRSIVYNKAPLTAKEFLTQRRRVYAGHSWVSEKYNYKVSTLSTHNNLQAIIDYVSRNPQNLFTLINLVSLEFIGRILGWFDYHILGRNPYIWQMVKR